MHLLYTLHKKSVVASSRMLLIFIAATICTTHAHAYLRSSVDRNTVSIHESIELHIESDDNATIENIVTTPLEALFTIANRASSQSVQIVNGTMQSRSTLRLRLFPKHEGVLVIPALHSQGKSTEPIRIRVSKTQNNNGTTATPAKVMVTTNTKQPYVQQQVLVTVRLEVQSNYFSRGELQPLQPLQPHNAHIHKVDEHRNRTTRNGISWDIIEQNYAVFIQQSGQFTINPVVFTGELLSNRQGFFQTGRQVQYRSLPLTLDVHPPQYTDSPWLPADNATVTSTLSASSIEIGQAITRTIVVQVRNQQGELIPDIVHTPIDNVQIYVDGIERDTQIHSMGVDGIANIRQVFIPQKPGEFTIAAQQLHWWSNADNTRKTLTIPHVTFQAYPLAATQSSTQNNTPTTNNTPLPTTNVENISTTHWIIYALASLTMLSFFANIWQWKTHKIRANNDSEQKNIPNENELFTALIAHTNNNTTPSAWFDTCNTWLKHIGAHTIYSVQGLVALIVQHCDISETQKTNLQHIANDWYYKKQPIPEHLHTYLARIRNAHGYPRNLGLYTFSVDIEKRSAVDRSQQMHTT